MYERLGVGRALVAVGGGLEYAMILSSGLLVALVMWPLALPGQSISPWWMVGGLLLGGVALHPRTLRAVVQRLSPNSAPLQIRYRDLLGWMLVYAGVWCFGGGVLYVLAATIHPLAWSALPVVIGIWATAGIVTSFTTFIPFGLGVQELTLTALLGSTVGSPAEALVVALLMRLVLTLNEVVWALVAGVVELIEVSRSAAGDETLNSADHATSPVFHPPHIQPHPPASSPHAERGWRGSVGGEVRGEVRNEQTVRSSGDQQKPHADEQKPDEVYKITPVFPRK